ncbi:hypothetical protein B0T22DRAFT_447657 [Podospora appendiculata]|uniref:Secreted protein n=1 Tax=Podospora appendiculata TaxID=314037 RepID=A0AAE0XG07_9PEZI|nr:hypothetical protein B0T22DRAFT_447657 [Podospora appendiculata]
MSGVLGLLVVVLVVADSWSDPGHPRRELRRVLMFNWLAGKGGSLVRTDWTAAAAAGTRHMERVGLTGACLVMAKRRNDPHAVRSRLAVVECLQRLLQDRVVEPGLVGQALGRDVSLDGDVRCPRGGLVRQLLAVVAVEPQTSGCGLAASLPPVDGHFFLFSFFSSSEDGC